MKRILLFGLLLCLCLTFAACTATDPNNLFGTVTNQDTFIPGEVLAVETYQYGNMQQSPEGQFLKLGNEVLFCFIPAGGNLRLYSYDLTTGEVRLCCDDATCKHSSCLAGTFSGGLEVYQGKLYALSEANQVVEIDGEETLPITKGMVGDFIHYGNKTYIRTIDGTLAEMEEGNDEVRIILDEYMSIWEVVFDNFLYARTFDSIIRVELTEDHPTEEVLVRNAGGITDGQYIYYVDNKSNYLYRCDMDGSNVKLLVEQEVLLGSINFDDQYFYYRLKTRPANSGKDSYDLYRFSKNNPQMIEKFATLPVPAHQVYTVPGADILFVTAYVRSNGESDDIYVMGTDGSHVTKLEIPEY